MVHVKRLEHPSKGILANGENPVTDSTESSSPFPLNEDPYQFLPRKDLLTLKEAAQFLNCCDETVRNMIRDSRLKAKKIKGGYIRIPRYPLLAAVEKYGP